MAGIAMILKDSMDIVGKWHGKELMNSIKVLAAHCDQGPSFILMLDWPIKRLEALNMLGQNLHGSSIHAYCSTFLV